MLHLPFRRQQQDAGQGMRLEISCHCGIVQREIRVQCPVVVDIPPQLLDVLDDPHQTLGLGRKVQIVVAGALFLHVADGVREPLFRRFQIGLCRNRKHAAQQQDRDQRTDQKIIPPIEPGL